MQEKLRCKTLKDVCFKLLAFLVMPATLSYSYQAYAETPKEKYQRIQRELQVQKEKLEKAKKQEHSVLEDLDVVYRRLVALEAEMGMLQRNRRQIEAETKRVEGEIAAKRGELDKKKEWMRRKLRIMQRYGQSGDAIFFLISSEDMSDLMRRWKYFEKIAFYERKTIEGYADALKMLDEKEKHLRVLNATAKKQEEKIKVTGASLAEKKKEKDVLLASVRKERESHEKMLKDLQAASKRLFDMLGKLGEKDVYDAKGFPALKGMLRWPVAGRVAIPYGSHNDPRFNTPVFRNGIYVEAKDDSVRAVAGGKIVFSDWFKGYGNLLIINHGESYHTLYANLSEIFFKVGDIIKGNEVIGRVGESGVLNAPSLYFELRYKGKPLDPSQWLMKR